MDIINKPKTSNDHIYQDFSKVIEENGNGASIVILTAQACSVCTTLKSHLNEINVKYTNLDIETMSNAAEIYAKLSINSVPVVVFKDRAMLGDSHAALEKELKKSGLL